MKRSTLSLFFVVLGMFNLSVNAQNLLLNSDMAAKGAWTETYLDTEESELPTATWGYTSDKPVAGNDGVLYFGKENTTNKSQYCIYQPVQLLAGESYEFDGAYKVLKMSESWFEVYIGTAIPEDGSDYGPDNGTRISEFNVWWGPSSQDGTFLENANNNMQFTPETDGQYYLIVKCGANANGGYQLLLDNLSLSAVVKPSASFTTNKVEGFTPLAVNFTSETSKVTQWLWNFGDGTTSTEENPIKTYTTPGTYSVKLTCSNSAGEVIVEKEDLIKAFTPVSLTGGGVVKGGDMSDPSLWSVSELNTPVAKLPTAFWNDKTHTPTAGKEGCLYIDGVADEYNVVQYCIYQTVTLEEGKVYSFDAAIKDFTNGLDHCFVEAFISDGEPMNGQDFGSGEGTMVAKFSTWDERNVLPGLDCTFKLSGVVYPYISTESGDKVLTLKIGTNDWENKSFPFKIAIDEISFTGVRTKPYPNFTSENNQGFPALEVTFESTSLFANSYVWDFGDGQTEGTTDIFINHTYDAVGSYNVSMKAINEVGDSTVVKEEFVIVANRPALPEGEKLYGGNMENRALWYIAKLGASVTPTHTWDYRTSLPTGGEGGCLRINAKVNNGTSNTALYQQVYLSADSVYTFDCNFREYSGETDHFWAQAYIFEEKPSDTTDNLDENECIGQMNSWLSSNPKGYDGSFKALALKGSNSKGDVCEFRPETSGNYYFIFKIGNTNWDNNEYSFDILIDNLSLKGEKPTAKPIADFMVMSDQEGEAPFEVEFYNLSENADTYLWEFGDESTSTDEHPIHTYTKSGTYSVKLTASKGSLSHTCTYDNLITVSGDTGIENADANNLKISTLNSEIIVDGVINSMSIYTSTGMLIESIKAENGICISSKLSSGIYVVIIDGIAIKAVVK